MKHFKSRLVEDADESAPVRLGYYTYRVGLNQCGWKPHLPGWIESVRSETAPTGGESIHHK